MPKKGMSMGSASKHQVGHPPGGNRQKGPGGKNMMRHPQGAFGLGAGRKGGKVPSTLAGKTT
jgi:hypothetical protein